MQLLLTFYGSLARMRKYRESFVWSLLQINETCQNFVTVGLSDRQTQEKQTGTITFVSRIVPIGKLSGHFEVSLCLREHGLLFCARCKIHVRTGNKVLSAVSPRHHHDHSV